MLHFFVTNIFDIEKSVEYVRVFAVFVFSFSFNFHRIK